MKINKGEWWILKGKFYTVVVIQVFKNKVKCLDHNDLIIRNFNKSEFWYKVK